MNCNLNVFRDGTFFTRDEKASMEYESMKAVGVDAKGRNKIMKRREECTLKTNRGF